jgi:hypothetical protein
MVVPSTANGFRAAVSALRSLDGKEGASFITSRTAGGPPFVATGGEPGKGMRVSDVPEELESLNMRVQRVIQLRSSRSVRRRSTICLALEAAKSPSKAKKVTKVLTKKPTAQRPKTAAKPKAPQKASPLSKKKKLGVETNMSLRQIGPFQGQHFVNEGSENAVIYNEVLCTAK